MGCDIHPVLEVKDDGFWEPVALPSRHRDYSLFTLISGVRDYDWKGRGPDWKPLAAEKDGEDWMGRGLPEGVSYIAREIVGHGDHSHTWFTLTEAEKYDAAWLDEQGFGKHGQWPRWLKIMRFYRDLYGVKDDEVRVVLSYDN